MKRDSQVLRAAQKKPSRGRSGKEAKPSSSEPLAEGQARVSAEECRMMISQAAYFRAEQRGFAPGHEVEDWLAAEQEIKRTQPSSAVASPEAAR